MNAIVHYHCENAVARIVLDDGKVNAVSPRLIAELNTALDRALTDKASILLRGREGVFSAGFDLPTLMAGGEAASQLLTGGFELTERLLHYPRPVVVACPGHALAMGVFLLLAGDERIGVDGRFKIGANEVAIGLTLPHAAIAICRERLAPTHFNRAVVNAEIYPPQEALAAGFLDRLVPAAELDAAADAAVARLNKLNMAAHAGTKQRTRETFLQTLRRAIEIDATQFAAIMGANAGGTQS